jgi:hypothetical protein
MTIQQEEQEQQEQEQDLGESFLCKFIGSKTPKPPKHTFFKPQFRKGSA